MNCKCTPLTDEERVIWDNYDEDEGRTPPTYRPDLDPLHRLWWLYGRFVYRPTRRLWSWIQHTCVVKKPNMKPWENYDRVPRFAWAEPLREWIGRTAWLPSWTCDLFYWSKSYDCPWCGDGGWIDYCENGAMNDPRPLFECVESGDSSNPEWGSYSWWEGWLWCYRCGHVEWYGDQSA